MSFVTMLDRVTATPAGAIGLLVIASFLEAFADSFFQAGLHRSSGMGRWLVLLAGVALLGFYGALVNTPKWDFGRLIGVYVMFFFMSAQLLNRVRFGQTPTVSVYTGGALVVAGGMVMAFWTK